MIRKYLNSLLSFLRLARKKELPKLPTEISNNERLSRAIFSPINLTASGSLKANSFKTPAGKDEVSVNRLDFTTPFFVNPKQKKTRSRQTEIIMDLR